MQPARIFTSVDKPAVLATIRLWMVCGLAMVLVLTVLLRLFFGHLPEPVGYATMAVMSLPLGPALVRCHQSLGSQFRFLARSYAIAGGAVLACVAGLRAFHLL